MAGLYKERYVRKRGTQAIAESELYDNDFYDLVQKKAYGEEEFIKAFDKLMETLRKKSFEKKKEKV